MRILSSLSFVTALCLMVPFAESRVSEVFLFEGVQPLAGGRFDGTTLNADGVIVPGLQVNGVAYDDAKGFASMAVASKQSVYVGSSSGGEVLLFDGAKYRSIYKSDAEKDKRVTALAYYDSKVWAAFAPSGRLVRIDADGRVTDVEDIKASYVWSILPDPRGGLRVATGAPGQVLHITKDGGVKSRSEVEAEHVTDLKWQGDSLVLSTAMPGRVFLKPNKGEDRVLFDAGFSAEIHRLQVNNDGIYVAVNGGKTGGGAVPAASNKEKPRTPANATGASKPNPGAGAFGRLDAESTLQKAPSGASLWHLDSEGGFRLVAGLGKQVILDMVDSEAGVLLALSKGGRVAEVTSRGEVSIVVDVPQANIASLHKDGWLVTGGGASVQRFRKDAARAVYLSSVRDAGGVVRIGHVDWHGESVRLEVRTGSTYDVSKANWTAFAKVPELGGVPRVKEGRFVQFRAVLGGANTHLRAVRVSYQAPNIAPTLYGVQVVDRKAKSTGNKQGVQKKRLRTLRKASKVLSSAKAKFYTGIKRIGFDVQDRNGDFLVFHVSVRRIGDRFWVPLTRDAGTPLLFVDWNAAEWPEGDYEVKVRATDAHENAPGDGLSAELVSGPIRVDNSPPVIGELSLRAGKLRFRVKDAASRIRSVRVAVGNGAWQTVSSNDGMIDSSDEFFAVDLSQLGVQSSTILRVQAQDSFGHLGRAGIEVRR